MYRERGVYIKKTFQDLMALVFNCRTLTDMLGHDRCNMAPLCEARGIFWSWCTTTHPLCRQQPQVFLCLSTPTLIVSKPQRRADWRVKTNLLFPDSHFKYAICANSAGRDERWNLGNSTCRPEVTIHVSFAHHWDYCSFLREIGEGGRVIGHEWCCNARQRMRLSHQSKCLIFLQILKVTCVFSWCCVVWWLIFRLESGQLQFHSIRDIISGFHQTEAIFSVFRF